MSSLSSNELLPLGSVEAGSVEEDMDAKDNLLSDSDVSQTEESAPESLKRWRQAAAVLNASRRFRYTVDLSKEEDKQETLRRNRAHAQAIRAAALFREASKLDNYGEPLLGPSESGNSHQIDIGEDNSSEDHEAHRRRNTCWNSQKVDVGWIFVITNFVLELPSAIFDQLSSVRKPQYALLSMLMSFAVLLICIVELIYKGRKEKVRWEWRATFPWFHYRLHSHDKPFCNFKDVIGLVCALCQSIVTTIGYVFCRQHADNPIKITVWPIIFAFGLLCSKFLEKPERTINV